MDEVVLAVAMDLLGKQLVARRRDDRLVEGVIVRHQVSSAGALNRVDVTLMDCLDGFEFGIRCSLGRQSGGEPFQGRTDLEDLSDLICGVFADDPAAPVADNQAVTSQAQHALPYWRAAHVKSLGQVTLDKALVGSDGPFDDGLTQLLVHLRGPVARSLCQTLIGTTKWGHSMVSFVGAPAKGPLDGQPVATDSFRALSAAALLPCHRRGSGN
jgi:hypothetical protein